MPEISIIIPFYNAKNYVKQCLEALLAQSFRDFEIICVDDGSKDGTYDLLQCYAKQDSRVKVHTQPNSGPSAARQLGLEQAQGKYIMFCDSDDWYEPDMCQIMRDAIENNPVDVVCCNANIIDEQEHLIRLEDITYFQNKKLGICALNYHLITQNNVLLWNKIWKKSIIDKYGIKFPSCREYDDDCFYLQYMSVAENILYISDKLYNYLRRQDSIMGKVAQQRDTTYFDKFYVAKHYYDFLQQHQLYPDKANIFLNYLNQIRHFSETRWNQDLSRQAQKIFFELFPHSPHFYHYIFATNKNFGKHIYIKQYNYIRKQKAHKKYIIKIGPISLKFNLRIK